jgi:hypothetical protein
LTTPPIRTRPDGTKYPITPPKPKWPGVVVGATVLAIVLGAGGTGVASSSGLTGTRASSSSAPKSKAAQDRAIRNVVQRLIRENYDVEGQFSSDADDCAEHSYGQVQQFFEEHSCTGLFRALFEVRDRRGGVVLVAIAWVDMPDARSAREFKELVDVHGTGNITELNRELEGYRYRNVRFTGEHYASRREDNTVVNAQAEPVSRAAVANDLAELAVQVTFNE